ncbi:MAG: hypothetical protein C0391_09710 [Anaerolinea sp.]|nr:hypothetical protein [Anaerolinea sp.]
MIKPYKLFIIPPEPLDGLPGALGTATHTAERIRTAGITCAQFDHHQYKCKVSMADWIGTLHFVN